MHLNLNEISDIEAIGSNGSSTIAAAAILVNTIIQKFKWSSRTKFFPEYLLSNKIKPFEPSAHVELISTISRI
jgi:hypothetical protein